MSTGDGPRLDRRLGAGVADADRVAAVNRRRRLPPAPPRDQRPAPTGATIPAGGACRSGAHDLRRRGSRRRSRSPAASQSGSRSGSTRARSPDRRARDRTCTRAPRHPPHPRAAAPARTAGDRRCRGSPTPPWLWLGGLLGAIALSAACRRLERSRRSPSLAAVAMGLRDALGLPRRARADHDDPRRGRALTAGAALILNASAWTLIPGEPRRLPARASTADAVRPDAWELQRSLAAAVSQGAIPDTVACSSTRPWSRSAGGRETGSCTFRRRRGRDRRDRSRRQVDLSTGPASSSATRSST